MKRILIALITITVFLNSSEQAHAIADPRDTANNHIGIHVIDENDLSSAAELVNSSGGEWGYVTIVIREDDRHHNKWQQTFDQMRRLKLIPLVRLATKVNGSSWQKPQTNQAKDWAQFLNSLNWVVKNRYIILFNEPNHAKEWGNDIKPHEYSDIANAFTQELKETSDDFFVLPAGFDAAASNTYNSMEMSHYFKLMQAHDPEIFTLFDGWTSHSYPNPNFSASPYNTGKNSIRGFKWETSFLANFGLKPNIPVFITETGWVHQEGITHNPNYISAEQAANNFSIAYNQIWTDSNLIAITPFVLNYQATPFDHFSWTMPQSTLKYPQLQIVKDIIKKKGAPAQIHDCQIDQPVIPSKLVTDSEYIIRLNLTNTGQSIWNNTDFDLRMGGDKAIEMMQIDNVSLVEPFSTNNFRLVVQTPKTPGTYQLTLQLQHGNLPFGDKIDANIQVIPPPNLLVKVKLWYQRLSSASDFTLLIYDEEDLLKIIQPFTINEGIGIVEELRDVVPNREYRFVITKAYYLPRQAYVHLSKQQTTVEFDRLIPIDFNIDGAFTFKDILTALRHPKTACKLLFSQ